MGKGKRVAIYVRLSDDKKKTGENVADQEQAARKIAKKMGLQVVDVYSDNSRTASDPEKKPRPEFLRLMDDAEAGRFDTVICRHVDRFFRHPIDQLKVSSVLGPRKITIVQEWTGYPVDVSTPSGVLNLGIAANVALYEINHKRERQLAYTKKQLKKGKSLAGGPRPFGFKKSKKGKLTPHPTEAALVDEATQHVLGGGSIGELVRSWNDRGIKAPRGGEWGYTSMRALLMRWSNAGIRQTTIKDEATGKKIVKEAGPGTWEAIVLEDDFRALLAKMQDPARTKHRGDTGRKHLLSHLLKCGKCGQPMRGGSTKTRAGVSYEIYQCAGLKTRCRLAVDYGAAEEVVVGHVVRRLASPDQALVAATAEERGAVTTLHKRLAEIEDHERIIEEGGASPASKQRQLTALNDESEEVAHRLASLTQRMALASLLTGLTSEYKEGRYDSINAGLKRRAEVRERFDALDLDRKRSVIRALLRVEVAPADRSVRPTVETARQRVHVTPLDPRTGSPYIIEEQEREAI
jgi:DNA invertase Pin-like site-specific DNA recombinase